MGLCGSFAVVPAFTLVGHTGGSPGRDGGAGVSGAKLADASRPVTDPASRTAVLLAEAATLALAGPAGTVSKSASPAPPGLPAVSRPAITPTPAVVGPAPQTVRAPSASAQAGQATWLDTIPTGTCANNDAPMGALLTVTNMAGTSITCRVVSRGPFAAGRIVDVARSTFRSLAATSQGVVNVAVSW